MIVLSYGMTKSGSTLAFELCKSVLQQKGYEQRRLSDGAVAKGHHINFLSEVSMKTLQGLKNEVASNEKIAVKVHAPIGDTEKLFIQKSILLGEMKVQVNFRDPREVALSLIDAGENAREKGRAAFSEVHTLSDAAKIVRRQLNFCRKWGSINGASYLFYNDVAFDTRKIVDAFCNDFAFGKFDDQEYKSIADRVFLEAFTQKNKGVLDRYKDDLTVRENEYLLSEIKSAQSFIRKVCELRDYSWFGTGRDLEIEPALE